MERAGSEKYFINWGSPRARLGPDRPIRPMIATRKTLFRHTAAWTLYGFYFYTVNALGNRDLGIVTALCSMPLFMFVYYGISHALNVLLFNRRYLAAALTASAVYALAFAVLYLLSHPSSHWGSAFDEYMTGGDFKLRMFAQTYLRLVGNFTIFALLGYQFRLRDIWKGRENRERSKRRRYEYTVLAHQVSPHMLANAFQSLDGQLARTLPQMRRAVLELYSLMNHFMASCDPNAPRTVLLSDEIRAARQFIAVEQGISGRSDGFLWELSGDMGSASVPATTLITLVGNVFKHGGISGEGPRGRISIRAGRDGFGIRVVNPLGGPAEGRQQGHGTGLANLRGRLEFVFGNNFELWYRPHGGTYIVELQVYYDTKHRMK